MGVYKTHIEPYLYRLLRFGGAGFNGTTQHGRTVEDTSLSPASITVFFEINYTTTANRVLLEREPNLKSFFIFTGGISGGQPFLCFGTNGTGVVNTAAINTGTWQRVDFTFDAADNRQSSYTNGTQTQTRVGLAPQLFDKGWYLAARGNTAAANFHAPCSLRHFGLANRALTAAEVAGRPQALADYLGGSPKPDWLLAYFPHEPLAVTGQTHTHEWVDLVAGRRIFLYNSPTIV